MREPPSTPSEGHRCPEGLALAPKEAVAELAILLARGYLRSLARKALSVAGKDAPGAEIGLDDSGEESVHGTS